MKHISLNAQQRVYLLQLLLAGAAVVLLLQVNARMHGANTSLSGSTVYGSASSVKPLPARSVIKPAPAGLKPGPTKAKPAVRKKAPRKPVRRALPVKTITQ